MINIIKRKEHIGANIVIVSNSNGTKPQLVTNKHVTEERKGTKEGSDNKCEND